MKEDRYDFSGKGHVWYLGWGSILFIGSLFLIATVVLVYYLYRLSKGG